MENKERAYFTKITLGCLIGMILVLVALTWCNASDISAVEIKVEKVKTSVELLTCNTDRIKPECKSDA